MKCNLNGWKILSGQFNSVAHFKKIAVELFGENFEAAEVVNGKYLLNGEEIAALFEHLDLSFDIKCQILSGIIKNRTEANLLTGIAELRQLLCALYSENRQELSCIDLQTLLNFDHKVETLSSFIRKNSCGTLDLPIPPFAAICKIDDTASAEKLSLPCGSMIIIDTENPPAPDEFCLFLKSDGCFGVGILNKVSSGVLLWSAPVLRLHLIPRQANI